MLTLTVTLTLKVEHPNPGQPEVLSLMMVLTHRIETMAPGFSSFLGPPAASAEGGGRINPPPGAGFRVV